MDIRAENLTTRAFAPFGSVLGPGDAAPNIGDESHNAWLGISDLMGIGATPGRQITYLRIHANRCPYDRMEKHETSAEAFIPLTGRSVLLLAPPGATLPNGAPDMSQARAFLLDGSKGVLLKKGVWHALPWKIDDEATFLVLVDDAIIATGDLHSTPVEAIDLDLTLNDKSAI